MKYDTACYIRGVYDAVRLVVIGNMRRTVVFRAEGGWLWELWIDARLVIFGWSASQERAQLNARMA